MSIFKRDHLIPSTKHNHSERDGARAQLLAERSEAARVEWVKYASLVGRV